MSERPIPSDGRRNLPDEPDRLAALFEAHAERLYRLARRLVPTADDAEDLVQETFLKAARSRAAIPRGLNSEQAWLVHVLVNIRRDQWRKETIRKRHQFELTGAALPQDDSERAFVIRSTVWAALDSLPPRRRAAVVMYEIEGLSIAAIAKMLGINAITVRWHLSRGRRELARQLGLQGGETDDAAENSLAGRRPSPSRNTAR